VILFVEVKCLSAVYGVLILIAFSCYFKNWMSAKLASEM